MNAMCLPAPEHIRSDLRKRQEVPILRPLASRIAVMEEKRRKQRRKPRRGGQWRGRESMMTGVFGKET